MKITSVKTHLTFAGWRNWVFVELETDEGITGLGEATLEGKELAVQGAIQDLSRALVGKDPRDIEHNYYTLYRDAYWRGGAILLTALSSLEMAMWDILGKSLGVPVYRLLGGKCHDRLRVYANGWYFGASTVDDFVNCAEQVVREGFTALKLDPFGKADQIIGRDEEDFAIECVKGIRKAVGDDVDLLIEAHGRFNPTTAIRIARRLEPYNVFWYEEPVPPENLRALAKVSRKISIPLATGERLYTRFEYLELLQDQMVDYIQPDVCHAGGILETKKIAAMAEAWHVRVAPHNPNGPVAAAATIQVAATLPNFAILEMLTHDVTWRDRVVREPIAVEGGYVAVPDKPGLGVELDYAELARHPYHPKDLSLFSDDSVLKQPLR